MYARYRTRSRFYKRPEKLLQPYNVSANILRRPKIKPGLLNGAYHDEKVDLRDRERLELLETIRHPKERDFYQDHTYHNQWIARDLEKHQQSQIAGRYRFFDPSFQVKPWIWYPGDTVEVIDGEGVGQRGAIIAVIKYKNEMLVQNVNVQDVVIPASETRPEQTVQREHPISVHRVRHIDPSTNELCHLELVQVRNKETGEMEERRISMESGVLLPIPEMEEAVESGDPLQDTAIADADEVTYDAARELPLLVERRLQEMENHFVKKLKASYEYHEPLRVNNAEQLQAFQKAVVDSATEKLAERLLYAGANGSQTAVNPIAGEALPAWWHDMLAPYVEALEEEDAAAAALEAQRSSTHAATVATGVGGGVVEGTETEAFFEEVEEEEEGRGQPV